ncbi:HlyD family secretion protein [Thermodesulfobacteriota bacterium]
MRPYEYLIRLIKSWEDDKNKPEKRPPRSVRFWIGVGLILLVSMAVYYELVAHYTPFTSDAYLRAHVIQIAPQVEGRVTAVHVSTNSRVKKMDKLYEIDPRPYRYNVQRLRALLVQAKQEVENLKRKRDRIHATIDGRKAELDFAQEDFEKIKALEEEGAYARLKRDKSLTILNTKKALLIEAKDRLAAIEETLAAQIDGEHASVKEVEAKLARAEFDLAHSTVYSPVDGYVTNLQLAVGSYAKVGLPVLTLVDTTRWWVVANFKENALARIRSGQRAGMCQPMYPGRLFAGRVLDADWGVKIGQGTPSGFLAEVPDPKDWVKPAQRFPVRLSMEGRDKECPRRVGASVTVTVYTEENHVFNALSRLWLLVATYLDYIY